MALEKAKLDPLLSGGIAGMSAWATVLPLDIIKTRIQNSSVKKSVARHAMDIVKQEGALALYKGWGPVMMRAFICNACCFKALEVTKSELNKLHEKE